MGNISPIHKHHKLPFPPTTSNILSTCTKSNMEENAESWFNLDF